MRLLCTQIIFLLGALASTGCSGAQTPPAEEAGPPPIEGVARPDHPLTLQEARDYAVALVENDRKRAGVSPLVWDDAAARAGQTQADDMAAGGFTAHLGSDGSVPEQRYTRAGGLAMVMENVGCFADGLAREVDRDPRFSPVEIERIHQAFMKESPPMDGHRRNVLSPLHTAIGIGLAKTRGLATVCMAQELVDDYGGYDPLPVTAKVGAVVTVRGRVHAPAKIAGVGVARVETPRPMTASELNQTHAYAIPRPFVTYFPRGFKSDIPLDVEGDAFHIDVPLSDDDRPGLYAISVWAKLPGVDEMTMVSLRTIDVR